MIECSIIIPTFNGAALLERCLGTIFADRPGTAHEVIVVDDGSTDETQRVVADYGDAVRVVHHPENAGFAAACNVGSTTARGRFLVFLNNDTRPRPGWLDALVAYARKHPGAAAIGAKLLYPDDTVQHGGVVFCQDGYPRHLYAGFPSDHPAVNRARRLQAVTAACLLVHRDAFDRAGGFDEAYRNGFEDVDLCLRLGESGCEIHYCPACVVEHLESVSDGRFLHDRENVRRYRDQWSSRVKLDDVDQYLADGLIRIAYETAHPHGLEIAPELAYLDVHGRDAAVESLLASRSRQVSALLRETIRLMTRLVRVELGSPPGSAARPEGSSRPDGMVPIFVDDTPLPPTRNVQAEGVQPAASRPVASQSGASAPSEDMRRDEDLESRLLELEEAVAAIAASRLNGRDSEPGGLATFESGDELRHRASVRRARDLARTTVPRDAAVLVVSRGDPELVALEGARARHFPQSGDGSYAGHHPANSEEAIARLEALRADGVGDYLLIPDGSRWWLEHYPDFYRHLEREYFRVADEAAGIIYHIGAGLGSGTATRMQPIAARADQDQRGQELPEWGGG
jgi:GT2 family glycosyltransferase